jgi:hypothetical protein
VKAQRKIRLLALAGLLAGAVAATGTGWADVVWWAAPLLAAAVAVAEVAVVHLSFGRQRWTFSLTEGAIAAAFVYAPGAWAVAAVGTRTDSTTSASATPRLTGSS